MATKAQIDAAKARAAAANKAYQNTPSYAVNYAQVKQENDSAINALNALLENQDNPKRKSSPAVNLPGPASTKLTGFTLPGAEEGSKLKEQAALDAAQASATNAERIIDTAPVGSAEFKKATADLAAIKNKLPDLQTKAQQATATADVKKANQAAADAQAKLDELKARAAAGSENAKAQLTSAQQTADAAKAAVSTASKGTTQEVRYDAAGNSLIPGTPAYDAGSPTKPSAKPAVTPAGKPAATGTAATTGGKKTAAAQPAAKPLTPDEAQAQAESKIASMGIDMGKYAVQMSLINSDSTLKELFYNDVYLPILNGKSPVDSAKFKADFQNTNWFKSYAEPARAAEAIKNGDPATWAMSVQAATDLINREAATAGYAITPDQADSLAQIALRKSGGKAEAITGLTLSDVQLQLKNIGKINTSGGQAATQVSSLKSFAGDYGVGHLYGDAQMTQWADSIAKGKTTLAAVEKQIKDTAISSYSALAPQINAGLTVKSIAAPYTQLYGTTLEVDPNAQNLSDPTFANSMFMKDPKDPNTQVLKPLWQYQSDLKKDPRWAYTDNARQSLDTVAHSVLKDMGFKY